MTLENAELAWPGGDTPGKLQFDTDVSQSRARFILRSFKRFLPFASGEDIRVTALCPVHSIAGRYQLRNSSNSWYVRISSRLGLPVLEKEIIDHLLAEGISVNPILYFDRIEWKGKTYRIDVRPFLDGRHFNVSNKDLAQLAFSLGRLHHSLKTFCNGKRVKSIAANRYLRLAKIKDILAQVLSARFFYIFEEYAGWAESNKEWLKNMAERFDPEFHCLPESQCIHGEIHPGNVLFMENGSPVLLDFEESVHVYAPATWDLAYFVQRFCLQDNPDEATIFDRLTVIKKEYGGPIPKLASMMRQLAWFSVAVILDFRLNHNILTPISECEKFVRLERQAKALENIL